MSDTLIEFTSERFGTSICSLVNLFDRPPRTRVEPLRDQSGLGISKKIVKQLIGRLWDRVVIALDTVEFLFCHRRPPRIVLMQSIVPARSVCNRRSRAIPIKTKRVPKPSPTPFSAPLVVFRLRGASRKLCKSKPIRHRCQLLQRRKLPDHFANNPTVNDRAHAVAGVFKWVTIIHRDIRVLSNRDRPDPAVKPEDLRRVDRDQSQSVRF